MDNFRVTLSDPVDAPSLETEWRALESRANPSVFQSWSWVQCWLKTPGVAPQLLTVRGNGHILGLAFLQISTQDRLFSRPKAYLQETGIPEIDSLYIEYNSILAAPEDRDSVTKACLKFLTTHTETSLRLRLSGVSEDFRQLAQSMPAHCRIDQKETSYFINLEALRAQSRPYLDVLSRNTRQNLKRSRRRLEAVAPIELRRAETVDEALNFLDALATLHQKIWRERGQPGAFENPIFRSFHQRYIETSFEEGSIDLLRVGAGENTLGYLLNFVHGGVVYQYQSGVDYTQKNRHPGYLTHATAIQYYQDSGLNIYNFMAGDNQQKASLSTDRESLYWITLQRPSLLLTLSDIARRALRR